MAQDNIFYGKVPPQAKAIEEAILGAILLEQNAFDIVNSMLKSECFYVDAHKTVFRAMKDLAGKGQPIDILTVSEQLRANEKLEIVGGEYAVTKFTNSVVSSANTAAHCNIVLQKYILREVIRVGLEMAQKGYDDKADAMEVLEHSNTEVGNISDALAFGSMTCIDEVLVKAIQKISEMKNSDNKTGITGVPSGFHKLDQATRGWQPGDLIIVAARPSKGKTAFALNLARNAAKHLTGAGRPGSVAVWSLEMEAMRLVFRMLAAESKIWLSKIQVGGLSEEEFRQLYEKGVKILANQNLFFDDTSGVTVAKIRAKARKLKKSLNLGLIIIDYLQLMEGDEKGNREREIAANSRELKKLAMELRVPIILLSQLNREVEKRPGGIPILADLRESGAIEQDADAVIFLYGHTEEQQMQDMNLLGKTFVKIAKQRDGFLATIELDFKAEMQLFENPGLNVLNDMPSGSWRPVKE